ncbi:hypothetical protein Tco_1431633, partial [Tanacetum coccineum]
STPVVVELHKEDLQATIGSTSLGVTGEEGANPQLSSVKSASTHTELVYSASTIIHSESASGHDALATSIAKADPRKTDANDSVSKQQDKTTSASKGLETIHTKVGIGKRASYVEKEITFAEKNVSFEDDEFLTSSDLSNSDDAKKEIKLEDLSKLVQKVEIDFMDLDSPKDDAPIIIQDEDDEEVHAKKDDVEKLTELLVKSLQPELSNLLSSHDFSNSLPTKLKELPSKFTDLPREIKELKKHVHKLEIELLGDLKEIPTKLEKEDRTSEIIPNFKANYLHLSEWREVVQDCSKRTGAEWNNIFSQIQTRMDYLHKTEAELEIDFNKPLSKQNPLDKLNDLARKKRKHADDIHDYFRFTKKIKSSVQYEDHPVRTALNEPCLGMILFNSHQRQDFVTLKDFKDFNNEMLCTVQEIFFRLHQGPGIDDHARTFSSFVLAEVDKRNLNTLKQIRAIEQLRQ